MKNYNDSSVNERLISLLKELKNRGCVYNDADFAKKTEISRSFLSDMKSGTKVISEQTVLKILNTFTDVNKEWLELGKGEMFYNNFFAEKGSQIAIGNRNKNASTSKCKQCDEKLMIIQHLEEQIKIKDQQLQTKDEIITSLISKIK